MHLQRLSECSDDFAMWTESIVLAATSARNPAEPAVESEFLRIALDVFGDRDTRAVTSHWCPVGRRTDVAGWVAGSEFEAQLELLSAGACRLPLLGNTPGTVERVRAPASFFAMLRSCAFLTPRCMSRRLSMPMAGCARTRMPAEAGRFVWLTGGLRVAPIPTSCANT